MPLQTLLHVQRERRGNAPPSATSRSSCDTAREYPDSTATTLNIGFHLNALCSEITVGQVQQLPPMQSIANENAPPSLGNPG
ncbi:hypothetical protein SeLEV6574_g04915 [Synchytrium endobioticum]|uniref:Uncharacterized protein n=1 Tax=Synchytrium endobioticum TaxID=286115 RepID=A0A507CWS9_9FUNG|nr:hypothetical protein SeLEV6574_g04915 [Synchytrium endobioticum]